MNSEGVFSRRIKSFVLRAGRMTPAQQHGWDRYWALWGLTETAGLLDIDSTFGRRAETVLEIGYGMGHSLIAMAEAEPEKNFIGIEVHRPGVGSLLHRTHEAALTNIRTYCGDAAVILDRCIPDSSLSRIQIYFPDPWHKKRHNKRRLIQPDFVMAIRPKLVPGGVLHLATDWKEYAQQMMTGVSENPGFRNCTGENAFASRPDFRPQTKFERRGENLGHGVWDLLFERIG